MPTYEIMTIAGARATSSHLADLVKRLSVDVIGSGGVVRGIDHLGLRPLAYRMRSHKKYHNIGRYFRITLQSSPQVLDGITQTLRQDSHIVKYLVTKQKDIAPKQVFRPPQVFYEPLMDNGGYDLLARGSELDLRVAAMLVERGLATPRELNELPKHKALDKPLRGPSTATLLQKLRKEYGRKLEDQQLNIALPPHVVPEGANPSTGDEIVRMFRQRQFEKYAEVARDESIIFQQGQRAGVNLPSPERGADILGGAVGANSAETQAQTVEQFLSLFRQVKGEASAAASPAEAGKEEDISDEFASQRADISKSGDVKSDQ